MQYRNLNEQQAISTHGNILACRYYHPLYPNGIHAIGDCKSDDVLNKKWDVFFVDYETKEAYYGRPMLGIGLMNCMILKSDTRPFLEHETQFKVRMPIGVNIITIQPIQNQYHEENK